MILTSALEEMAAMTGWPPEVLLGHLDLGDDPDPEVLEWIAELARLVETQVDRRIVILHAPDLYRETGGDLAACRRAMETPYEGFTPLELTGLALSSSIRDAIETLDTPRGRAARDLNENNPFHIPGRPKHALPNVIHHFLGGASGLQVAQRWEEHLAKCEGCRENAAYVDRCIPDDDWEP